MTDALSIYATLITQFPNDCISLGDVEEFNGERVVTICIEPTEGDSIVTATTHYEYDLNTDLLVNLRSGEKITLNAVG